MAASFYSSPIIGATTTLACFAHEIPHEIADYSILVRSGFSKRQAMQSQYVTAVGAFVRYLFFCFSNFISRSSVFLSLSHLRAWKKLLITDHALFCYMLGTSNVEYVMSLLHCSFVVHSGGPGFFDVDQIWDADVSMGSGSIWIQFASVDLGKNLVMHLQIG